MTRLVSRFVRGGGAEPPASSPGRAGRRLRAAGFAAGLVLLLAAIGVAVARRDVILGALEAVGPPSPLPVMLLPGCVVANVALSAALLRLLLLRFGRVGRREMLAVISAATLVNFLPLRPGLFGRIAYHRVANDIPALATARTMAEAAALSASAALYLAAVAAGSIAIGAPMWYAAAAPVPLLLALWSAWPRVIWFRAGLIRYAEVLIWAGRYHLAFALIGAPVTAEAAVALACVSVVATLVPFVSNGLGLREWAVGLLAPVLAGAPLEMGVTAELINRAAEIVVVVVMGTGGMVWLGRKGVRE